MRQAGINFRNDIISGVGGKQILAEDPSGNRLKCSRQPDASHRLMLGQCTPTFFPNYHKTILKV